MPPFPLAKIAQDISGNQYIIISIDMYSSWPEAFSVPNKKTHTITKLISKEIFPRFRAPLQVVTVQRMLIKLWKRR